MNRSDKNTGTGRRRFLKQITAGTAAGSLSWQGSASRAEAAASSAPAAADTAGPVTFPRVLRGEKLAAVAFPIGGIGTGCISVGGRGELRDWEIFNTPAKGYAPWYSFPAIWAKAEGDKAVTRILEAPLLPPHEYPSGDWFRIPAMPRMEETVFTGDYPFAHVEFIESKLPVQVALEAFNPLIPLDIDNSSLPMAVLRYRLRNPGLVKAAVSIALSVNNPIGEILGQAGRINEYREAPEVKGFFMHCPKLEEQHPRKGSLALALVSSSPEVTYIQSWRDHVWEMPLRLFWDDFSEDGRLDPSLHVGSLVPEYVGTDQIEVCSLCASEELAPGEEKSITFLLTWHIPNRTPEICGWDAPKGEEKTLIGNFYCRRFRDAWDVVSHAAPRLEELEKASRQFVESLKDTTLPPVVLDAAVSNLSTLKTNTVFRTEDGRFHGFEGCKTKGCCFGSCTHVWNYESMLPHLFPALSRSFLDTWLGHCTDERGLMSFRYYLPMSRERFGFAAADGQMGVLLRLYLDWRLTGDAAWLKQVWPKAKRALEFAWIQGGWDEDQDGVMEGCQHNTYDIQFLGPNPLSGVLYLGALRACEEMARVVGDNTAANRYQDLFKRGSEWIDAHLFNGEYYIQKIQGRPLSRIADGLMIFETERKLPGSTAVVDPEHPLNQMGEGSLADQLFGQELAHIAGLGYLLKPVNVRATLDSVHRYNFKPNLSEHLGQLHAWALNDEAAVVLCDYTRHPPPKQPFLVYTAVLSGVEYMVAAHMFFEGKYEQGMDLVKAVRNRYDGRRRNPWNEIECGYHYSRALASWSCILALCGFGYQQADGAVTLSPRMPANPSLGFWCVPSGWGGFSHRVSSKTATVEIWAQYGKLACHSLQLGSLGAARFGSARISVGKQTVAAAVTRDEGGTLVTLQQGVDVVPGESLLLRLSE
jgi:non-lysosomal glucosylceramidase